jgi:hypothetical protein
LHRRDRKKAAISGIEDPATLGVKIGFGRPSDNDERQ